MKLKYKFVINSVAGSLVAVPVGNDAADFKGYVKLNETGAFIFKMLQKNEDKDAIVEGILKEFTDVSKEEAVSATEEFLSGLAQAGIIEND